MGVHDGPEYAKTKILLDDYEKLDEHDVRIISISENLPNNEMTTVFLAMLGGINESSSIRTSKHVTRCQRANAKNGFLMVPGRHMDINQ